MDKELLGLPKTKERFKLSTLDRLKRWNSLPHSEKWNVAAFLASNGYSLKEVLDLIVYFGGSAELSYPHLVMMKEWVDQRVPSLEASCKVVSRSKGVLDNTPETPRNNFWDRYDKIPSDDSNRDLFYGSFEIAQGYLDGNGKETLNINSPKFVYDPLKFSYFGSVQKQNSTLFVADLDTDALGFGGSLEKCWEYAKKLYLLPGSNWKYFKFSGRRGFHLIEEVVPHSPYEMKVVALSIDPDKKFLDFSMFQRRKKIRGFCKNLKSGWLSVSVDPSMSLSDVLRKAKGGVF